MTKPVRIDRYGREVRIDTWGMEYVRDAEDGFAWYITPCCDAAASINDGPMYCKGCYNEVDSMFGGVPEPHEEDMDEEQKEKLRKWKEFEADIVRRSLGK